MIFDKESIDSFKWVILSVLGALGIGIGSRRVISKDARDRAKDDAETSIFAKSLAETRADRDSMRRSAEEAWGRLRESENENALLRARVQFLTSQWALIKRLVRTYPELATFLPFVTSEPTPLDALSDTPKDAQ